MLDLHKRNQIIYIYIYIHFAISCDKLLCKVHLCSISNTKMYRAIEIWHFITFWRQDGAAKIHQVGGSLKRRTFLTKKLLKRKLYDRKGSQASDYRGLSTDCLTQTKRKGLRIIFFYSQTDLHRSNIYIYTDWM